MSFTWLLFVSNSYITLLRPVIMLGDDLILEINTCFSTIYSISNANLYHFLKDLLPIQVDLVL